MSYSHSYYLQVTYLYPFFKLTIEKTFRRSQVGNTSISIERIIGITITVSVGCYRRNEDLGQGYLLYEQ